MLESPLAILQDEMALVSISIDMGHIKIAVEIHKLKWDTLASAGLAKFLTHLGHSSRTAGVSTPLYSLGFACECGSSLLGGRSFLHHHPDVAMPCLSGAGSFEGTIPPILLPAGHFHVLSVSTRSIRLHTTAGSETMAITIFRS